MPGIESNNVDVDTSKNNDGPKDEGRRDFMKYLGTMVGAAFFSPVIPKSTSENAISEAWEQRGEVYISDPYMEFTVEGDLGVGEFPFAIPEGSTLKTEKGDFKLANYGGGVFDEVTMLHLTEEPESGSIVPVLYKLPKNVGGKEIDLYQYVVGNNPGKRIKLNERTQYYVIPIVDERFSTTIFKQNKVGEGNLTFALLQEGKDKNLQVMGVVRNSAGRRIFTSEDNFPEEYKEKYLK